ncbi:MAG: TetR/AcrR family transcriptional regulator [Halieaceae bacterium]
MPTTAERMLVIATEQFAEKGYAGASMRDIASVAGTTQAAIYHHYPNKQALYDAVLDRHFAAAIPAVLSGLSEIPDPENRLRELVQRIMTFADADAQFRQLYLRELLEGNTERLATLANNIYGAMQDSIASLAKDLNDGADVHLLLFSIIGLICHHLEARELAMLVPGNPPDNCELATLSEHISQLLLGGIKGL